MSVIYKIENTVNGRIYVGQTQDTVRRWNKHKEMLKSRTHSNRYLQAAWNKYGEAVFTFSILEEFNPELNFDINQLERFWIEKLNSRSTGHGYNLTAGGEGAAGYKHTEEARKKISAAKLGKMFSQEHKRALAEAKLGKQGPWAGKARSTEDRKRMSKGHEGKPRPWKWKAVEATELSTGTKTLFESITAASSALGLTTSVVTRVCKGKAKSTNGYSFAYHGKADNKT